MQTKRYEIAYGVGKAILYTPHDCEKRFYTLVNTCFGIRKNIFCCNIISEKECECEDYERLEFSGDVYVWDKDGRRKMIAPEWCKEEEWDDSYCEECKYKGEETKWQNAT